jgi:hypothetical protein
MSGSASIDLERQLLGHTLAISPMPTLGRVYVALCLTAPTEAAGGTEASGGGYNRTPATFALMSSLANAASNAASVEFPAATGNWGTIGYFELWTQATGGTRLYWGALTDPADGVPVEMDIVTGDVVRFSAGALIVQAAEVATYSRGADVINVKDYGAVGDGTTNDYAAIAAAMTAAKTGNIKVVYFPASATPYRVSSYIAQPAGTTLFAYPGTATIAPTSGNVAAVLLLAPETGASNIYVYGLIFDGGGRTFPTHAPLTQGYKNTNVVFENCKFQNARGMGFNGSNINDLVVRGCVFSDVGAGWKATGNFLGDNAQALTNSADDPAFGFRSIVEDCRFSECGGDHVNLGTVHNATVTNNTAILSIRPWDVVTPPAPGYSAFLFAQNCTDVVCTGNQMIGMSGNAIDAPGAQGMVISDNIIIDTGQGGIGVFDSANYPNARECRNITIAGNIVKNSGNMLASVLRSGIELGGASLPGVNIRVVNNVCTDTRSTGKTQQYGVYYRGAASTSVWIDPSNALTGNAVGRVTGWTPAAVTGAKGGNAALASLLTTLAAYGLITDSSTA